jgi:hypothetical protein
MKRQITQRRCWGMNQSWLINEEAGHPEEVLGRKPERLVDEKAVPQRRCWGVKQSWLGMKR